MSTEGRDVDAKETENYLKQNPWCNFRLLADHIYIKGIVDLSVEKFS